ncbi:Hypothetical protein ETEE_1221 [Edwardsiella anguillarum ET080813]|uniref:Uncharacterized protein n=1 Tax=Edwardsiella anguillarum ET080813 TaxID=667120 RepID=A0A076LGK1_9GAMM|nr:Hypothetical protein ETEE_1221 [Edwardsiella anguillarum ET080813]
MRRQRIERDHPAPGRGFVIRSEKMDRAFGEGRRRQQPDQRAASNQRRGRPVGLSGDPCRMSDMALAKGGAGRFFSHPQIKVFRR